MPGHTTEAAEAYFAAHPEYNSPLCREVFDAGHLRALPERAAAVDLIPDPYMVAALRKLGAHCAIHPLIRLALADGRKLLVRLEAQPHRQLAAA